jgi:hypothetical protein
MTVKFNVLFHPSAWRTPIVLFEKFGVWRTASVCAASYRSTHFVFSLNVRHCFRAVRCVPAAIVDGGDNPPCATGRLRNRIVFVARKCVRYSMFSSSFGYVSRSSRVMFSVPQTSVKLSCFGFSVVALWRFIVDTVSDGRSFRGVRRRHRRSCPVS